MRRESRRPFGLASMVACSIAGLALGVRVGDWRSERESDRVEARKFVVRNEEGVRVAALESDSGRPMLRFWGEDGESAVIEMGLNEEGATMLVLGSVEDGSYVRVQREIDGDSSVEVVRRGSGHVRLSSTESRASMVIGGADGKVRVRAVTDSEGNAAVGVANEARRSVMLHASSQGTAGISANDSQGTARVIAAVGAKDNAGVWVLDADGRDRIAMEAERDGALEVTVFDESGQRIWSALEVGDESGLGEKKGGGR